MRLTRNQVSRFSGSGGSNPSLSEFFIFEFKKSKFFFVTVQIPPSLNFLFLFFSLKINFCDGSNPYFPLGNFLFFKKYQCFWVRFKSSLSEFFDIMNKLTAIGNNLI